MKIQFRCGCGLVNHSIEDWVCHWKHGTKGKFNAVKLFLTTRVELVK